MCWTGMDVCTEYVHTSLTVTSKEPTEYEYILTYILRSRQLLGQVPFSSRETDRKRGA
jgi:hypothetical protein